jgi:hypothetical protein
MSSYPLHTKKGAQDDWLQKKMEDVTLFLIEQHFSAHYTWVNPMLYGC